MVARSRDALEPMLLVLSLVMRAQCFLDDATSRCSFCSTGKGGFTRSLKGHEIVKQVLSQQPASCHIAMKDRCKPCVSLEFHPTPSRVRPPSSVAVWHFSPFQNFILAETERNCLQAAFASIICFLSRSTRHERAVHNEIFTVRIKW